MKTAQRILEIESLCENIAKKECEGGLLRMKVLYFISQYENLSVSMIIEKLGIKKTNFALLSAELEKEGLVESRQADIDRRCRTMSLTDKGRDKLDEYLSKLSKYTDKTTPELDRALEVLLNYLNKKV